MAENKITRADAHSATILVMESDPLMLTAMGSVLNMNGYRAVMSRNEQVALEVLDGEHKEAFDLAILSIDDLNTGGSMASKIRAASHTKDIPIVFIVPELNPSWSEHLGKLGGVYSLLNPFEPEALIEIVQKCLWMPHIASSKLGKPSTSRTRQRDWISLDD